MPTRIGRRHSRTRPAGHGPDPHSVRPGCRPIRCRPGWWLRRDADPAGRRDGSLARMRTPTRLAGMPNPAGRLPIGHPLASCARCKHVRKRMDGIKGVGPESDAGTVGCQGSLRPSRMSAFGRRHGTSRMAGSQFPACAGKTTLGANPGTDNGCRTHAGQCRSHASGPPAHLASPRSLRDAIPVCLPSAASVPKAGARQST